MKKFVRRAAVLPALALALALALPVAASAQDLVPVGRAVGIEAETDGLLVASLSKVQTESGKQRYVVLQNQDGLNDKYIRVLRDSFMSMDMAQNILVIKTVEGMAMAAGVALDAIHFHEIVGCVAGDNTIFCAVRSVDDTIILMDKLKKLLAG